MGRLVQICVVLLILRCLFQVIYCLFFFLLPAAAAAAAAASSKEKSWTLGNVSAQRKKQNKQMPARPRSVNSTFEKRGKPPLGYATLSNDRTSNRSFQENGSYGNRYVVHMHYILVCNSGKSG